MLDQTASKLFDVTAAFAALAKANPKNYNADFLHGKALAFGGQCDEAEILLRKSVGENDEFWESHFELGGVLEGKRDFAVAAREFHRAAELSPKNPGVQYRLARIYYRLGIVKMPKSSMRCTKNSRRRRTRSSGVRPAGWSGWKGSRGRAVSL
jgi:Flp pilus assembly protein TadD